MQAQRESVGLAPPGRPPNEIGSASDPIVKPPTLEEAGIDKHLADRARKLAAVPVDEFEERIEEWRTIAASAPARVGTDVLAPKAHVSNNSGDNEWYTPESYVR